MRKSEKEEGKRNAKVRIRVTVRAKAKAKSKGAGKAKAKPQCQLEAKMLAQLATDVPQGPLPRSPSQVRLAHDSFHEHAEQMP